jgi:hypothetical protein
MAMDVGDSTRLAECWWSIWPGFAVPSSAGNGAVDGMALPGYSSCEVLFIEALMNLISKSLVIAILIMSSGSGAVAQCMDVNQEAEAVVGELARERFADAAGRLEEDYIVKLPAPICLSGDEEIDNVEGAASVHLVPNDDSVASRLQSLLGRSVLVRGLPFGAITAHHHAPIVMSVVDAEERRMIKPEPGSALRAEILDAARPVFQRETQGPIEFVVRRLNVIGEWAYGEMEVQRPGGETIDWNRTRYAEAFNAGMFDPAASDFLLRKSGSTWSVIEYALGATDVVWVSWRLDHRLPLALFQW